MSKICTIFHECDLDGWMSAAIVKHWFITNFCGLDEQDGHPISDDSLCMMGYNYGQPIPDLSEYDKVIMCDISFPKNHMESLQYKLGNNFIWIDHHISAINDCRVLLKDTNEEVILYNGMRDTKFAACELTWKYFFPNETIPEIVRLLGRYDCFGHKGTDEERKVLKFQYGARQVITNYIDAYDYLTHVDRDIWYDIYLKGEIIYQYLCTEAKQVYKNGFCATFLNITIPEEEYNFICINKERFNPINFGIDYHKDGYDGCACFHYANNKWNFSLYNDNGNVDCSVIAKQYGGGGHAGASGFILTKEQFMELIK